MKNDEYTVRLSVYSRNVLLLFGISIIALLAVPYLDALSSFTVLYTTVGVVLIVVLGLIYVFPLQYLKLVKLHGATMRFQRVNFGEVTNVKTVKLASCWWNYTDIDTSLTYGRGGAEPDPNNPKNTGTGNMDSSGIPTEITLYLKFLDENGEPIVLYQEKGNWASIPNWDYDLAKSKEFENAFECNGLEKLLVWAIVEKPTT